jgi:hypothetical protein
VIIGLVDMTGAAAVTVVDLKNGIDIISFLYKKSTG